MSLFYALDVLIHDMFCFVTILYAVTTVVPARNVLGTVDRNGQEWP